MLIKGTNVIGLQVITIEKGRDVDNIKDLVYDPYDNTVKALVVDNGGLFSEAKVIPLESVYSIGQDAVIVQSEKSVRKVSDLPNRVQSIATHNQYLTKARIVTDTGDELGSVTDIYFDPATGRVHELEVSQGGINNLTSGKKRIKISDIVTVGKDAVIVRAYAEEEIAKQAQQQGIQGTVNQGLSQTQQALKNIQQQVNQQANQAEQTVQTQYQKATSPQTQAQVKQQVQQSSQQAQSMIQQAENKLEDIAGEVKNEAAKDWEALTTKTQQASQSPQVQQAAQNVRQDANQAQQVFYSQVTKTKQDIQQGRINHALGRYVTKNILNNEDKMLARRGSMITHKLIDRADEAGVIDQVLDNTSEEPIIS